MDFEEFRKKRDDLIEKLNQPGIMDNERLMYLQSLKSLCARAFEFKNISADFEREIKDILFKTEQEIANIKRSSGVAPAFQNRHIKQQPIPLPITNPSIPQSMPQSMESQYQSPPKTDEYINPFLNMDDDYDEPFESINAGAFNPESSPILRRLMKKMGDPDSFSASPLTSEPGNPDTAFPSKKVSIEIILPQFNKRVKIPFTNNKLIINRSLISQILKDAGIPHDSFNSIDGMQHCILNYTATGSLILQDPGDLKETYCKGSFVDRNGLKVYAGDDFLLPILLNNKKVSLKIVLGEIFEE